MSDIQDLIYTTTMDCLERGRREEQQRIIKLLENLSDPKIEIGQLHIPGYQMREVIALIKGDK